MATMIHADLQYKNRGADLKTAPKINHISVSLQEFQKIIARRFINHILIKNLASGYNLSFKILFSGFKKQFLSRLLFSISNFSVAAKCGRYQRIKKIAFTMWQTLFMIGSWVLDFYFSSICSSMSPPSGVDNEMILLLNVIVAGLIVHSAIVSSLSPTPATPAS